MMACPKCLGDQMQDDSTCHTESIPERPTCERDLRLPDQGSAAPLARPSGHFPDSPGESQPPLTIRGVQMQVHWLEITLHDAEHSEISKVYQNSLKIPLQRNNFISFGDFFRIQTWKKYGYEMASTGKDGSNLFSHPYPNKAGKRANHVHIELKGTQCEQYSLEDIHRLLVNLSRIGSRMVVTRIDFAFDHHSISPQYMIDAWYHKRIRTRCRGFSPQDNPDGSKGFYIGSASSERILCVYDKRGFNRAEFRLKTDFTKKVLPQLLQTNVADLPKLVAGWLDEYAQVTSEPIVRGRNYSIDPGWSSFIGDAFQAQIPKPEKPQSSRERLRARARIGARLMKVYCSAYGVSFENFMADVMLRDKDQDLIEQLQMGF